MTASSDPNNAVESILKRIISNSHNYLSIHPPRNAPSYPLHRHSRPLVITSLPNPPSLISELGTLGLTPDIAQHMDQTFRSRALAFKQRCETVVNQACSRLVSASCVAESGGLDTLETKIVEIITEIYTRKIASWASECMSMVANHLSARSSPKSSAAQGPQVPFNHDYVPLLEHFFEENPFPSHADKVFLAKKSGMTYRQIHVWFQNKRNRTKNGKVLRKKPMSEGATLPLDSLVSKMERYIIPKPQSPSTILSDDTKLVGTRVHNNDRPTHALDSPAPRHAFPTVYPSSCLYDPFPIKDDLSNFRVSEWPRRPSPRASTTPTLVDMAAFVEAFAQLNVRDDFCSRIRRRHTPTKINSAATSGITTVPSTAPHPAFIATNVDPSFCRPIPLAVVSAANKSKVHIFATPSPDARPITLVPHAKDKSLSKGKSQRKVAPLPRRTPRNASVAHRESTPFSFSETSDSSPLTPSRSISGYTEPTYRDRSLSGSSSYVTTPLSSPHSRTASPYPRLDHTSTLSDLVGDLYDVASSAQGLRLGLSIMGDPNLSICTSLNFADQSPFLSYVRTLS
ncbi:hypothetical protein BS17DRAFT_778612 [Gyrodon lividus]|nr:hypothetical protein BS17DRAFT_778612 [Gyrodon lividus]